MKEQKHAGRHVHGSSGNRQLSELRNRIDRVDAEILTLLLKRMDLTRKVGQLKNKLKLAVQDERRESEIIERLTRRAGGRISKERLTRIFRPVFESIRAIHEGQSEQEKTPHVSGGKEDGRD
ncbi:MAG: chorismate mutase [Fidelibacterota bacterium]